MLLCSHGSEQISAAMKLINGGYFANFNALDTIQDQDDNKNYS